MKTLLTLTALWLGLSLWTAQAQVVQDPLLAYYKMITAPSFDRQNDGDFQYSPQTPVYYFEAELDGSEHKAVFVTDKGNYLGERGQYAWSVYAPVKSGGYHLVTDSISYITAGRLGPSYIGYIDQLKKYGVIVSGRDAITAYYLQDGVLKTQSTKIENILSSSITQSTSLPNFLIITSPPTRWVN